MKLICQFKNEVSALNFHVAMAMPGADGDSLSYDDLTAEQIAQLQQPALEAATALESAEALRVENENQRIAAEQLRAQEFTTQSESLAQVVSANSLMNVLSNAGSSFELVNNTFYTFTAQRDSLSISLPSDWDDSCFAFVKFSSSSQTPELSFSSGVVSSGTADASSYVEISILGSVAIINSLSYE